MQPRTLLAMLGVILALGAFILFYEKDLPSTDERRELEKKVVKVEEDDVEAVVVEWDGNKVRLEREAADEGDEDGADRDWRLVEPLQARADRTAVTGLLSSLTGLEKKRTLEDVDRGELGLDEPEVEVTLVTTDGDDITLAVGAEVPASSDRIVAAGGVYRGVYQVAGSFVDDLTREPGEWRDKSLFTASRGDVDRVTLAAGEHKVLLAKRGEDFWIESPLTDRADDRLTDDLLTGITGLRVATFLDAPSAEDEPLDPDLLGLDPPRETVEVVLKDQEEPFRLELGLPVGSGRDEIEEDESSLVEDVRFYGRAEGQLFEIETGLGEALARAAEAWRSREWTALEVFKIETVKIETASVDGDGGELDVVRDGADWKRGDDRIDYTTASDLLYALTDAAAEEVVDRAGAESRGHRFDGPSLSVHLTTKDGEESLALYPVVDGFAAATSEGRDAVLLLAEGTVTDIHEKIEAVKTAEDLSAEDLADEDLSGEDLVDEEDDNDGDGEQE